MSINQIRKNAKPQHCERCGHLCQPGDGHLYWLLDADDNDDFDRLASGDKEARWAVDCLDEVACKSRIDAAKQAEVERIKIARQKALEEAQAKQEKAAAFAELIAGLARCEVRPIGDIITLERVEDGDSAGWVTTRIQLADSSIGYHRSYVGDQDYSYYLIQPAVAAAAEAEATRRKRLHKYGWPIGYGRPDTYPGPGVPIEELTESERLEVERLFKEKYECFESDQRRCFTIDIMKSRYPRVGAKEAGQMEAVAKLLEIPGASLVELVFPADFSDRCRVAADSRQQRITSPVEVRVKIKLPDECYTKTGKLSAKYAKLVPTSPIKQTAVLMVVIEIVK